MNGSASDTEELHRVDKSSDIDDGDNETKGCIYIFKKGKKEGEICGKSTSDGSDTCSKHAIKNKSNKDSKDKSDKSDSLASDKMKTLMTALNSCLTEILTNTLKPKYVEKAMAAIMDEKGQEALAGVVKENMLTKVMTKSSNAGGKRRKKDPTAPKKNSSAYIFFCKKARADVKASHPDMKGTDVTKELGRIWREDLDDDDKAKFVKEAADDKARYEEEMKHYTPSPEWQAQSDVSSDDDGDEKKKKKKTDRKSGPKRALSAYIFFCKDAREDVKARNNDMDAKDVTRELGRIWREDLHDKDKEPYIKLAENDKERYNKEKEEWVEPGSADDDEEKEIVAPKSKKTSKQSSNQQIIETTEDHSDSEEKKSSSKKSSEKSSKKSSKKSSEKSSKKSSEKSSKKSSEKSSKKSSEKNLNPFVVFCQSTRPDLREENPDWSPQRLTAELGKMWAGMDDEEKNSYC